MGTHRLTYLCLMLSVMPGFGGGLTALAHVALSGARNDAPLRAAEVRTKLLLDRYVIGLPELGDLQLVRHHVDPYGQTHVRLQQMHQGLPVWGGEVIRWKPRAEGVGAYEALTGAVDAASVAFQRSAATYMPHIAPSIIQKCRQWSVSMMKLSPTVPR